MGDISHKFVDTFVDENHGTITVNSDDTNRYWALVVHEGAECYNNFEDRLIQFNARSNRSFNWAYIVHDMDTICLKDYEQLSDEEKERHPIIDDGKNPQKYALVPPHIHAVLAFEDLKSWSRIKKGFPGAHVAFRETLGASYAYLTHDTSRAIRQGKYRYPKTAIVTNNADFFESNTASRIVFETFDPTLLAKYIFVDGLKNYIDFVNPYSDTARPSF